MPSSRSPMWRRLRQAAAAAASRIAGGEPMPLFGVPIAVKDLMQVAGFPQTNGTGGPEARAGNERCRGSGAPACGRRAGCRNDQPPRIRLRRHLRESPFRICRESARTRTHAGRIEWRFGGCGRGRHRAARDWHRHCGIGQNSCGLLWRGRIQAFVRRHPAYRRAGAGREPRSCRTDRSARCRRRARLCGHGGPATARSRCGAAVGPARRGAPQAFLRPAGA